MAENMGAPPKVKLGGDRSLKATPHVTDNHCSKGVRDSSRVACQTDSVKPLGRLAVVGALLLTTSCTRSPQPGVASFCDRLGKDKALLELPMTTPEEVTALVARYRALDKLAPEEISDDWHAVTELIAKVAESDVSKAKQPDIVNLIYATTKSINATKKYTKATCNIDFTTAIAPPTTIGTPEAPTTTVP
jgi:hypothetical protein